MTLIAGQSFGAIEACRTAKNGIHGLAFSI